MKNTLEDLVFFSAHLFKLGMKRLRFGSRFAAVQPKHTLLALISLDV